MESKQGVAYRYGKFMPVLEIQTPIIYPSPFIRLEDEWVKQGRIHHRTSAMREGAPDAFAPPPTVKIFWIRLWVKVYPHSSPVSC